MRLLSPLLAAVAACALVAGCTSEVAGRPAAPTGTPAAAPVRPRELRLDGVDPCSLLTPQQRAELGVNSEPRASRPYAALFRGDVPTCTMSGPYPDAVLLGIGTVTTVGIERWSESDVAATVRSITVAGFPAVVAVPTQFTDYCNVEVDVASGQLLDVQYGVGTKSTLAQDQLCTRASRSAELMITTLLAH